VVAVVWGGWRGWGKPPVGERILTTMLMTDIAESTERVAAAGDAAWDQLLDLAARRTTGSARSPSPSREDRAAVHDVCLPGHEAALR
jgi:hypothetical protein